MHVFKVSNKAVALNTTLTSSIQPEEVVYNTWFIVTLSQKGGISMVGYKLRFIRDSPLDTQNLLRGHLRPST